VIDGAIARKDPMPNVDEPDDWWEVDDSFDQFVDNVSGKLLSTNLVLRARAEEIEVINNMKVWKVVPRPPGKPVLKGRWVDINKGDEGAPDHRSRWVAKEIKKGVKSKLYSEFFASMPSLSSFKFLMAIALTSCLPDLRGHVQQSPTQHVLGFLDVRRAHFVSAAIRELYCELPPEVYDTLGYDGVALLLQSLYGTRDAGFNWDVEKVRVMVGNLNFLQDSGHPSNFWSEEHGLRVSVHGDDFTSEGSLEAVQWFHSTIQT
jgi:hypothetical protein